MPSRTLEDKVEELTKLTAAQAQQIASLAGELQRTVSEHVGTAGAVV
jgi:hypothetical protein